MDGRKKLYLCIYEYDQAYGGPEEGGWWYEYGVPLYQYTRCVSSRLSLSEFYRIREGLQAICNRLNRGRLPVSSVLSEGQFKVCFSEEKPEPYPTRKPYYC